MTVAPSIAVERVIDVDTTVAWSLPDERSRQRRPVPTIVTLTLAVLVVLTGPTLLQSKALTLAWQVSATTRFFWLSSAAVYTVDAVGGGVVQLSARAPSDQKVVWSLPLAGPLARVYSERGLLMASDMPPSDESGVRTTIFGEHSSVTYPAAAVPLIYMTVDLIVSVDRDTSVVPVGADQSRNGLEWTHLVTARDLRTRAVLWSRRLDPGVRWALPGVRVGAAGIVGLPAGTDWMAAYSTSGLLDVWDLHTGGIRAHRAVGPLTGQAYVTASTDAVVAGRVGTDGTSVLTAYDPHSLAERWQLTAPLSGAEPVSCEPQLCLVGRRAVFVVDPWTTEVTARVDGTELRPGPPGEVVVSPYGRDTMVISTRNGEIRSLHGDWRVVDATAHEPDAVVARVNAFGWADLGLLDVHRATVTTLGRTNQWSAYYDCLAVGQTLACDDGTTLSVWRRGAP